MPDDAHDDEDERPERDDRPPICPACGVTMGLHVDDGGAVTYVCLECGYPHDGGAGS
jgi:ribosomal protein S27AE